MTVVDGALEVLTNGDSDSDLTSGKPESPTVGSVPVELIRFSEMNTTSGLLARDVSDRSEVSKAGNSLLPARLLSIFCSGTVVEDLACVETVIEESLSTVDEVVDVFEERSLIIGSGGANSVVFVGL
jgi:hypothetical protein